MRITTTLAIVLTAALAAGCSSGDKGHDHSTHHGDKAEMHAKMMEKIGSAVCVLYPTEGNKVSGTVTFTQMGDKVKVVADVSGLSPNGTHAIHVHQFGDATAADGTSAGGHYNPEGHDHGLPGTDHRHAGDLGNLKADANGNAKYTITVDNISVAGLMNPILGRSIIVHAKADDGGQPTGNAGPRIACGVIGVKNTK